MDRVGVRCFLISIWIDVLMDMLAMMMALRILRVRIRPVNVCFAAIFGCLSAQGVRMLHLSASAQAALWLPLSMLMMRISGRRRGLRIGLTSALTLLACLGFLGGMVLALYGATGSIVMAYMISGACAAAVFVGLLRTAIAAHDVCHVQVECVINGKTLLLDAVVDSGNSLRDYLTHRPVIVAGAPALASLGAEDLRMRPIFADTAGGRQMMQLVIPKQTSIIFDGKKKSVHAALAFAPALGKNVPALVPSSLMIGGE